MKKICRTIKLRKFKSFVNEFNLKELQGQEFMVLFSNGTWVYCINKDELTKCLEKDHIKPIRQIYDFADRIMVNRDVLIDTDEV